MTTKRSPSPGSARHRVVMTLLTGLLATLIVVSSVTQHGDASGLIGVGPNSPAYPQVHLDIPHAVLFTDTGLDGALFYAIARHPLDVRTASKSLDYPTYRLRRILFPLAGGLLAPGGGAPLIYVLAGLSILGTMLGAWWLAKFPRAPNWLPLTAVINPGVILALGLTLSDALATGLVLAAFGAMFNKRVALAVVFLTLACLTRETSVIAAFALCTWPGLTWQRRATVAIVPAIPVGLWSIYVALTLDQPLLQQNAGGTFSLPFKGWIEANPGSADLMIALIGAGLIVAALTKWRSIPLPVTVYLAVTLAMVVCAAPIIAQTWFGTGRVIAVAFPLSLWVVARRPRRRANPTLRRA